MSLRGRPHLAALGAALVLAGCATLETRDPAFPPAGPPEAPSAPMSRPEPAAYVPQGPLVLPATEGQPPHRAASLRIVERAAHDLAAGRDDAAARQLDRAIRLDPSNPYAFYLIALHRHRQGVFDQSLAFARKAEILLRDDPSWLAETYLLMALNQEALGRPREALRLYEAALAIEPDRGLARGRVAELRRALP
ncbi:MAG TPA: tetratricopeptide repeat protein [Thermodesulfobacteriota bacterium]